MTKKKLIAKKIQPTLSKEEIVQKIIEEAQGKRYVTYESIIEAADKHHFTEIETSDLLKELENKNIDLIMQKELDDHINEDDTDDLLNTDEISTKVKTKIDTTSLHDSDIDDAEKDESDTFRNLPEVPQIADGVKCYLRDIGKIPLLNKKTEKIAFIF